MGEEQKNIIYREWHSFCKHDLVAVAVACIGPGQDCAFHQPHIDWRQNCRFLPSFLLDCCLGEDSCRYFRCGPSMSSICSKRDLKTFGNTFSPDSNKCMPNYNKKIWSWECPMWSIGKWDENGLRGGCILQLREYSIYKIAKEQI